MSSVLTDLGTAVYSLDMTSNLIPTIASNDAHARYVDNIVTAFCAASSEHVAAGRRWYPTARQVAYAMAIGMDDGTPEGYDRAVRAGSGVIAALSPQKAWSTNVTMASKAFQSGVARGHVPDACVKASRIMNGEDPLTVLPDESKTWNFFRCIVDPSDADAVVIDRHAHDVAVGVVYGGTDRGLSNKRRYATVAHAYREAARVLGELPQVVQAVVWVAHVERKR